MSIALRDGRAYFVTAAGAGKAKRIARDPRVTLAPCTASGKVVGGTVSGLARRLPRDEPRRVRGLLRPTRALLWSYLLYRLRGRSMEFYEVVPADDHAS